MMPLTMMAAQDVPFALGQESSFKFSRFSTTLHT